MRKIWGRIYSVEEETCKGIGMLFLGFIEYFRRGWYSWGIRYMLGNGMR